MGFEEKLGPKSEKRPIAIDFKLKIQKPIDAWNQHRGFAQGLSFIALRRQFKEKTCGPLDYASSTNKYQFSQFIEEIDNYLLLWLQKAIENLYQLNCLVGFWLE